MKSDKIILGIDPGTNIMGYGIIKSDQLKLKLIQYGVIHLKKYSNHGAKLKMIFDKIIRIPIDRVGSVIGKSGKTKLWIEEK